MTRPKENENTAKEGKESEYFGMTPEEKSDYLEGKLYILNRNSMEREKAWVEESERIKEERLKMGSKLEEMKREINRLKEELREEKAESRMIKRIKNERHSLGGDNVHTQSTQSSIGSIRINQHEHTRHITSHSHITQAHIENIKNISNTENIANTRNTENTVNIIRQEYKQEHIQKTEHMVKCSDISTVNNSEICWNNPVESLAIRNQIPENEAVAPLPIEWILSHLKGEVLFGLSDLSSNKLKVFGRFFKREFDSLYNKKEVLAGIEGTKSTKHLIKCLLYLSDRPEIISSCMPYVFMKHIVPDGKLYIKDIVRILYKVGLAPFLQSTNTIDDVKRFFNECSESEELFSLIETLAEKSPRAVARFISEEYLVHICKMHPDRASRVIGFLEGCGAYSGSSEAIIALHAFSGRSQYNSPNKEYTFFL
ncbi:hypothetical protein NEIRO03_1597 [Nematocida sp. AWRm78]|nr:hypothetical protein NEIRO03_1597 [Nematocida sp. AWRm78]